MYFGFVVLKTFSQLVYSPSFSGYSTSGFKLKQWVLLLTESCLVKLDAKVNANEILSLARNERKRTRESDHESTLRQGRKEGTEHGRTKGEIELMS